MSKDKPKVDIEEQNDILVTTLSAIRDSLDELICFIDDTSEDLEK